MKELTKDMRHFQLSKFSGKNIEAKGWLNEIKYNFSITLPEFESKIHLHIVPLPSYEIILGLD